MSKFVASEKEQSRVLRHFLAMLVRFVRRGMPLLPLAGELYRGMGRYREDHFFGIDNLHLLKAQFG